jgi:hypothetical protein
MLRFVDFIEASPPDPWRQTPRAAPIISASHCKINHGNALRRNLEFRLFLGRALVTRKSERRKGVTLATQKQGFK